MTTWEAAHQRFLKFIASMGGGEQPEGETVPGERVAINMAPKTQDRLQATPGRYPRDIPPRQAIQPAKAIPPAPERRPVQGLGDLAFSGPMPGRRPEGPDDAGYDLERLYQREAQTLPDRSGRDLEEGRLNTLDRAGLGAYHERPANPIDELGGNAPHRKFRW